MLFGHSNDANQPQPAADPAAQPYVSAPAPDPTPGVNPLAVDPVTGASLPTVQPDASSPVDSVDTPSVLNQPSAPVAPATPVPDVTAPSVDVPASDSGLPFGSDPIPATPVESQAAGSIAAELDTPGTSDSTVLTPDVPSAPDPAPAATLDPQPSSSSVFGSGSDDTPAPDSDLLGLKQQAISQLSPLVNHLEQSPEEKFRTTMMLIQSTDNSTLLQDAYTAARNIPDEKVRAQALLDIVNEINYFTQQKNNTQAA